MLRSALHTDCITAAAASFYRSMQSQQGDLLNQLAPVGMVVRDLLAAIGLPENAIGMVMGHDQQRMGFPLVDTSYAPMVCCFCEETAIHLIESKDGPRAICVYHADELTKLGYKIVL